MVDAALCPDEWGDATACSRARVALEKSLDAIRREFGDIADLYRPWCEADDDDNQ